jgi:hypothetical protein
MSSESPGHWLLRPCISQKIHINEYLGRCQPIKGWCGRCALQPAERIPRAVCQRQHLQESIQIYRSLLAMTQLSFRDHSEGLARGAGTRLVNNLQKALPMGPRPIDDEGLPLDCAQRDESPESTVIAVIPVVSHDEEVTFGHLPWPKSTPCSPTGWPFSFCVVPERVIESLSVDEDLFPYDFDCIPRQAYDSLNEILALIERVDKNDHIISFRLTDRDNGRAQVRDLDTIYELVHQDMIPHKECRLHGTRRDLKSLDNKGPDKKRQDDRNGCGLGVFSEYAFLSL